MLLLSTGPVHAEDPVGAVIQTGPAPAAVLAEQAETAARRGDYDRAIELYEQVIIHHTDSEEAQDARGRLSELRTARDRAQVLGETIDPPDEPVEPDRPSADGVEDPPGGDPVEIGGAPTEVETDLQHSLGQLELVVSQGIVMPVLLGGFLPPAVGLEGDATALLSLAGLGVGTVGSIALTNRHPMDPGQAMAVYTAQIVGAWNTGAWAISQEMPSPRGYAITTAGTLVGTGAGLGIAYGLSPDAGRMAVVRSGFTWGVLFTTMTLYHSPTYNWTDLTFRRLQIGSNVGLLAGLGIATVSEVGRGRVNLISLGGLSGAVVGIGAATAVGDSNGTEPGNPAAGTTVIVCSAAGLVATGLLSRNLDGVDVQAPVPTLLSSADSVAPGFAWSARW